MLERREVPYPLSTPRPGWSEQNPDDWWEATEQALDGLTDGVAGIGLSGQMHGLVTLDAADRPIRPAILWNDQRTGAECAEIEERVGFDRLVELTGNRALTGFTAPKLLWLRKHEPENYARIAHVMLPKDYVRLRLTGERAIDVADASGTLLLDVAQRRWSDEVLRHPRDRPRRGCRPCSSRPRSPAARRRRRGRGGRGRPGGGRARRRRRPPGAAVRRDGHLRRRLRRAARVPRRPAGPRPRLLPRRPRRLAPDGRDALRRRLAAPWLRNIVGGEYPELTAEAERWAPGTGGADVPAVPDRRAHAARRPGRARRVHRPGDPPRPRRARPRRARGRRLRPARLVRPRRRRRARPRLRRRRAQRALGLWLQIVASCSRSRSSGSPSKRARPTARRCSAASPAGSGATSTRRSRRACARTPRSQPVPSGSTRTASCGSATGRFTRLCRQPAEETPR